MQLSKITVAVVAALGVGLGAGMASTAFALDLYVDKKTKQIFTEAGPNREKIGSFTKVDDAPAESAVNAGASDSTQPRRDRSAAMRRSLQVRAWLMTSRSSKNVSRRPRVST